MLPDFLDISHMKFIMVVLIVVSFVLFVAVVKVMDKAMLRVFVSLALLGIAFAGYHYYKDLNKCRKTGKACSILGYKVPNVDTGNNDLTQ